MSRFRASLATGALLLSAVVLPAVFPVGATVATPDPSVDTACAGNLSGSTFTLTANCDTTVQLTVPDGQTLNGGGHIITGHDPSGGDFSGAVLTNAGASMMITDLTVDGTGFAIDSAASKLMGIFFLNATGSISNVTVANITQHSGCPLGQAIRANSVDGTHRAVTLTNVTATNYQKSALVASGTITVNVSGSTFGPSDNLTGVITENGVQYGGLGVNAGAGGTITSSTIYGSGFGMAGNDSTALLLYGASGVTLTGDTVTGSGTDVGVAVTATSTGVVVNRNQIGRSAPDVPDTFGTGVEVDPGSSATVTCNAFTGWRTDVAGVPPQSLCVFTNSLPNGTVGTPYPGVVFAAGGTPPYTWSVASGSLPQGLTVLPDGLFTGTPTSAGTFSFTVEVTDSTSATALETLSITITGAGYWMTGTDGGVFAFGSAAFHGSLGGVPLNAPIIGMAAGPGGGYWLVGADGGVFAFGVPYYGSLGGLRLNAPIVGIAATPDGGGYYLVGADGGAFAFGDAVYQGSMGGMPLNAPVVRIAVSTVNQGYYLVGADGGVFAFGDAAWEGSMGGTPLNEPVVGIAVDETSPGYWLVARDGGVFSFDAPFLGSMGGTPLDAPVVGMAAVTDGGGYSLVALDGGMFCFGSATFEGSMGGTPLNGPVVGMASTG